ncbi:hypothetical protein FNV43_RR11689 [Rhamnella rubrinervis]|uniref:Exocyst subunit Exo70 family protein n=1 Tax=Rhamnella rubrinervis TaxID=2594499 RepID=A0A8K0MI40_9ROSA|nr:hypothetical protein FNV43_RR11689 [Rhamnella rubrinervis]
MASSNKNSIENLIAASNSLRVSLEKSKALGLALQKSGPRLEEISQRLPSLEAAVRPIRADKDALGAVGGHINRAVGPAAAVLKGSLDGGLLEAALDKLENEFRRLLTEHSVPLPMSSSIGEQACIAPSPLPVSVIQKLQAILGRLIANNRLEKCISIYVEIRSSNVRASLQALDLDYLEISISEFNDVQSIEGYIAQWGKHLEFAVKHLFEVEYKLCNDVFERIGLDVWMDCFAKIAAQAGILAFLQFGKTVTESKKDPVKLLKLLDIFASLNKLRLDFNRLFGGAACIEIQNLTRDLIKRVIDGAAEIFWELLVQVELQRQTPPPQDGEYEIVKAIELNLETWMKAYEDATLSYMFAMNNHWHLFKHLRGTKLGQLLGDSWLREHEQSKDYYAAVERSQEKTCQLIVQAVVPVYRSYMQNYGPLVEQDTSSSKYAKYSVQSLENMILSLFQPKPGRYGSFKGRSPSGKFNNGVSDLRRTASAVV